MPFASQLQTNFTAGEISPRLFGRIDIEKYLAGAAAIENMVVLPHGGLARRGGLHFVIEVRDSTKFTRLIPLQLSATLAYVLEFGEGYIRFHTSHATVIDGRDFTNGTFDTDIAGWTDISDGTGSIAHDAVNLRLDLIGVGAGNEARAEQSFPAMSIEQYTVTVDIFGGAVTFKVGTTTGASDIATGSLAVGADQTFTFQSAVSRTLFITFENANSDTRSIDNVRLNSPLYTIDSPFLEADLDLIKFTQTTTALYLAHPDWAPRTLARLAVNNWVLALLDFVDGPYLDFDVDNQPTTTLDPSAASGTVTVTASSIVGINDDQGFLATDSGRILRLDNATLPAVDWGWGVITGVTDTLNVTVEVREPFAAIAPTTRWRLGAWSNTTGWPAAVGFFEQRLVFANSDEQPDRFWMSKAGAGVQEVFSPSDFDGTVNDDNAITYEIADDQVNAIHWLDAGDVLVIGTATGEYVIRSGTTGAGVTPTRIEVKRQTTRGSDRFVRPVRIDQQVLHLQRAGRKIRNFFFDFDINGYVSDDITIIAEHITRTKIFEISYQQEPDSVIWAARGDGQLLGLTFQPDQKVAGWHRHIVGGTSALGDAVVESVAAIPTPGNTADELWCAVARTINGTLKRYIEFLEQPYDLNDTPQESAFFVDSGLTYDGVAASVFTGIDHLEGETVSVLADGAVHPDVVVTAGQVTLTAPASKVQLGLRYTSKVKLLSPPAGGGPGPAHGKTKRVSELILQFFETLGARYGIDPNNLDIIPFRAGGDPMNSPPPIFSGFKKVLFPKGYDRAIEPIVEQDQPLPMTLLTATMTLQTTE